MLTYDNRQSRLTYIQAKTMIITTTPNIVTNSNRSRIQVCAPEAMEKQQRSEFHIFSFFRCLHVKSYHVWYIILLLSLKVHNYVYH